MHRSTIWRHKTGRSKKHYPHGEFDHKGVATHLMWKYFWPFWNAYREDARQEIELLLLLAKRKDSYGKNNRLGLVRFSRMAQRHFSQAAKNYGFSRGKGRSRWEQREILSGEIMESSNGDYYD